MFHGRWVNTRFLLVLFFGFIPTARAFDIAALVVALSTAVPHADKSEPPPVADVAVVVETRKDDPEWSEGFQKLARAFAGPVNGGPLSLVCVAAAGLNCDAEKEDLKRVTGREVEVVALELDDVLPPPPPDPKAAAAKAAELHGKTAKNFRDRIIFAFQRMFVSGGVAGGVVAVVKGAPDARAAAVAMAAGVWSFTMQMGNQLRFQWQRSPRLFGLTVKPGEKEAGALLQLGKRSVQSFAYAFLLNGLYHALRLTPGDFVSMSNAIAVLGAGLGSTALQTPWDMWNKDRSQRMEEHARATISDPEKLALELSTIKKMSDRATRTQSIIAVMLSAIVAGRGFSGEVANYVQMAIGAVGLVAWWRENPSKSAKWLWEILSAPVRVASYCAEGLSSLGNIGSTKGNSFTARR